MSNHTYHQDVYRFGLADDCPRCYEHAQKPWESLDEHMLSNLRDRIYQDLPARSQNEDIAMSNLALHDRQAHKAPTELERYSLQCFDCSMGGTVSTREQAWAKATEHSRENNYHHHVVVALRQGQTFLVFGNIG